MAAFANQVEDIGAEAVANNEGVVFDEERFADLKVVYVEAGHLLQAFVDSFDEASAEAG